MNCLLNSFQPLELTKIDFLVYYCDDNGLEDDYLQKLVFKSINRQNRRSSINIFKDCKFSDVFGMNILKFRTKNKMNLFIMDQNFLLQGSLFSNYCLSTYSKNLEPSFVPEQNKRYFFYDLSNNQLEDFDSMTTMASEYSLVINLHLRNSKQKLIEIYVSPSKYFKNFFF